MPAKITDLRISLKDFMALPEYSATNPTGTMPGKRWRRLDGAHDMRFLRAGGQPRWYVLEYDPNCPPAAREIKIFWYRPIIRVPAGSNKQDVCPHNAVEFGRTFVFCPDCNKRWPNREAWEAARGIVKLCTEEERCTLPDGHGGVHGEQ